jgi:hypothetical protein
MRFCELCNNMLYMRTDDDRELTYYCRNCSFAVVESVANLAQPVTDSVYNRDSAATAGAALHFNKSIKHDVTLPRVNNIPCPNAQCTRRTDEEQEVIYIKKDPVNMRFMYFCCKCDHFF